MKVAGTSSSSAEVLCPVRPTGLMGGVTSWPGLVHLRRARMHWRWTCHCQHHAVPRCWQGQIGGPLAARAFAPFDARVGRLHAPHVGACARPIGAFAQSQTRSDNGTLDLRNSGPTPFNPRSRIRNGKNAPPPNITARLERVRRL